MFIGENPSWEKNLSSPLSSNSKSGKALDDNYLNPLRLCRDHVWITNLFKCRYKKPIKELKKDKNNYINECKKWLVQEIKMVKPKIIITLSDKEVYQSFRHLFNLSTPNIFKEAVGRSHDISIENLKIKLFPMVHPHMSIKNYKKGSAYWSEQHKDFHIPSLIKIIKTL
jgi:uracil-DNA glycosylase family 4